MCRTVEPSYAVRTGRTLHGSIERRCIWPGGRSSPPAAKVLFVPDDPTQKPFGIRPASAGVGLVHGARAVFGPVATAAQGSAAQGPDGAYAITFSAGDLAAGMVADVVQGANGLAVRGRGPLAPYETVPLRAPAEGDAAVRAGVGDAVVVAIEHDEAGRPSARVVEVLGAADCSSARFLQHAMEAGSEIGFPPDVMAEIEAIKRNPGIEDAGLEDLTDLPFVTIDNDYSKDFDQAVYIERLPVDAVDARVARSVGNYVVHYAIADASHFVPLGSALDRVASRRFLTTYLPGRDLPVLPRELSEDLCSLMPNQKRRAFVASVTLDGDGKPVSAELRRAVVRSRAQLSYNGVQDFFDRGERDPLAGQPFTESLELLREVGEKRLELAEKRRVVPFPEGELRVVPVSDGQDGHPGSGDDLTLELYERNHVELCNEQISILVNAAVAEKLARHHLVALHRYHPKADDAKSESLRQRLRDLGAQAWKRGEDLASYVRRLDPDDPLHRAAHTLVCRLNERATYSAWEHGHAALKLSHYDHFTAPMRRYADVAVHRVLAALVEGRAIPYQEKTREALDRLTKAGERAAEREFIIERRNVDHVQACIMQHRLHESLTGHVTRVSGSWLAVALDDVPVTLSVPCRALQRASGGGRYTLARSGIELRGPGGKFALGDEVQMTALAAYPETGVVVSLPTRLVGQVKSRDDADEAVRELAPMWTSSHRDPE